MPSAVVLAPHGRPGCHADSNARRTRPRQAPAPIRGPYVAKPPPPRLTWRSAVPCGRTWLTARLIDDQQSGSRAADHRSEGAVAMRRRWIPVRRILILGPDLRIDVEWRLIGKHELAIDDFHARAERRAARRVADREKQLTPDSKTSSSESRGSGNPRAACPREPPRPDRRRLRARLTAGKSSVSYRIDRLAALSAGSLASARHRGQTRVLDLDPPDTLCGVGLPQVVLRQAGGARSASARAGLNLLPPSNGRTQRHLQGRNQ